MKSKNLEYYLSLDYDIQISRLEVEGFFSYKAFTRELDQLVFYGAGDTKIEALNSFEKTKAELFELYIEENRTIPEPTREDIYLPSGKLILRFDPKIHLSLKQLAVTAKKSLNSYIDQVLIAHVTKSEIVSSVESVISKCMQSYQKTINIDRINTQPSEKVSNKYKGDYAGGAAEYEKKKAS